MTIVNDELRAVPFVDGKLAISVDGDRVRVAVELPGIGTVPATYLFPQQALDIAASLIKHARAAGNLADRYHAHALCLACWNERNPDRPATTLRDARIERCCFCGNATASGIYRRGAVHEAPYCADRGDK